jgi:hypothetical protein
MVPADYIAAWIEHGKVRFDVIKISPGKEHQAARQFAEKHHLRWWKLAEDLAAEGEKDALPIFLLFALDADPEEICDLVAASLRRQRAALERLTQRPSRLN